MTKKAATSRRPGWWNGEQPPGESTTRDTTARNDQEAP